MDTTNRTPDRSTLHRALLGARAQVVWAGLLWAAIVLAPRWSGAPDPVRRVTDALPAALTGLPAWTAALGALVVLAALVRPRRG